MEIHISDITVIPDYCTGCGESRYNSPFIPLYFNGQVSWYCLQCFAKDLVDFTKAPV